MTADVIQFPAGRSVSNSNTNRQITSWVPDISYRVVDGVGIPCWTGNETLCRLIKNVKYTGDPKSYPYENPYTYEVIGCPWDPVQRKAPPPACPVRDFDWDAFELEAVASGARPLSPSGSPGA